MRGALKQVQVTEVMVCLLSCPVNTKMLFGAIVESYPPLFTSPRTNKVADM